MKVADLHGPLLDYWVAKALGKDVELTYWHGREDPRLASILTKNGKIAFSPRCDWSDCGPLLDKVRMDISYEEGGWCAAPEVPPIPTPDGWHRHAEARGESALLAICRAFIIAKIGEEVPE